MTPKEKAKQLVEAFTFNCRECDNAKQYALICVDEILIVLENKRVFRVFESIEYWQEVKNEIETL
jgi:hypothetical protein